MKHTAQRAEPDELEALLTQSDGRVDLVEYLSGRSGPNDEILGQLIEVEGRERLARGLDVTLERYLSIFPTLPAKPAALDAAIEAALRSLVATGSTEPAAVESLLRGHPALRVPILEASRLNEIFQSTNAGRSSLKAKVRVLPAEFGERRPDGTPPYLLLDVVGRGSSAVVYKAKDLTLSDLDAPAVVAVKVFPSAVDSFGRAPSEDEARKARRIEHPHVARVLQWGISAESEVYIVSEFVEGGDLHERITTKGPLEQRDAARLVVMIARGMQAAHSSGVLHLDLKPANILVSPDGMPKITDFGSACRRRSTGTSSFGGNAREAVGGGTIAFMAPEQFHAGDRALDPPVDIYGIGAVLRFCLAGVSPNGSGGAEIADAFLADGPRPVDRPGAWDAFDPDLVAIARRALDRDPNKRFTSPAEMADDLASYLRHEPIRWTRPTLRRRARLFLNRHRRSVIAGSLALALILTGSAFAFWSQYQLAVKRRVDAALVGSLGAANASMQSIAADGFMGHEVMLHWLMVSAFMRDARVPPDRIEQIWSGRHAWSRQISSRYAVAGREESLEAHLWKTCEALWFLDEGRPRDAIEPLRRANEYWHAHLAPDDPWLSAITGLEECARADLLIEGASGRPPTPDEVRLAREHADALRRAEAGVALLSDALLFRVRFLEREMRLHDAAWLNQPAEYERAAIEREKACERLGLAPPTADPYTPSK